VRFHLCIQAPLHQGSRQLFEDSTLTGKVLWVLIALKQFIK
jgi:hypothetical protein